MASTSRNSSSSNVAPLSNTVDAIIKSVKKNVNGKFKADAKGKVRASVPTVETLTELYGTALPDSSITFDEFLGKLESKVKENVEMANASLGRSVYKKGKSIEYPSRKDAAFVLHRLKLADSVLRTELTRASISTRLNMLDAKKGISKFDVFYDSETKNIILKLVPGKRKIENEIYRK